MIQSVKTVEQNIVDLYVGRRLKLLRNQQLLSQKELANTIEVTEKRKELLHKPNDDCSKPWFDYLKTLHPRVPTKCSISGDEKGMLCF